MEKEKIKKALEILREAQEGKGAYSQDQLKHAENTIEDMKTLIGEAIDELEKIA